MILSYTRVSTEEQAADGTTSLAEQQRKNKAIAMMRGVSQFDFLNYQDKGVSGSIPLAQRPAGGRLMQDANPGDVVVASKLDRLFRSASDALNTIELLQVRRVEVILVDIGTEPVTVNGTGKLFLTMLAAFAEFERTRIGERMNDGRRGKKERNGHIGGAAPYGYKVVGQGREARLEPEPREQDMIRKARQLHEQKISSSGICRKFEEMGLRDRAGHPFRETQVLRILERPLAAQ